MQVQDAEKIKFDWSAYFILSVTKGGPLEVRVQGTQSDRQHLPSGDS